MSGDIIYLLSNASMNVFSNNTRSLYSNTLAKPITASLSRGDLLWVSLESVTLENYIIQYPKQIDPDIIYFTSKQIFDITDEEFRQNEPKMVWIPEKRYTDSNSFFRLARSYFKGSILNDIYLSDEVANLIINPGLTLISKKLVRFLKIDPNDYEARKYIPSQMENTFLKGINDENYIINYTSKTLHIKGRRKFDLNEDLPEFIKIKCSNIKQYVSGGAYSTILSCIPFNETIRTTVYIPFHSQFHLLNQDCLTNISVKFLDQNDNIIKFGSGSPTIIKFRIKKMENQMDSFYIHLSNIDSKKVFEENTQSSFVSKLPKEINLSGRWVMALKSVFYPLTSKLFMSQ